MWHRSCTGLHLLLRPSISRSFDASKSSSVLLRIQAKPNLADQSDQALRRKTVPRRHQWSKPRWCFRCRMSGLGSCRRIGGKVLSAAGLFRLEKLQTFPQVTILLMKKWRLSVPNTHRMRALNPDPVPRAPPTAPLRAEVLRLFQPRPSGVSHGYSRLS